MRYIIVLILVSFVTLLQASSIYPELYAKQGTPLYKSINNFKSFNEFSSLETDVNNYIEKLKRTKEIGIAADSSDNKADKIAYLKALRSLQSTHDKIIKRSVKILMDTIKENDYKRFYKITNIGIDYYKDKSRLKEKIVSYYKKNRHKKKSRVLDKIARHKKIVVQEVEWTYRNKSNHTSTTQRRNQKSSRKNIIILTTPTCPACIEAKKWFKATGKRYTEYNINKSSKGMALYKKHNGWGVPLIIIGDKVMTGLNTKAVEDALK